ncbi:Sigma-70, region 4 [compost metagenome]
MDNNTVIKLLTDYRSYKFALTNLIVLDDGDTHHTNRMVYSERIPKFISNYNTWYDRDRYARIVEILESAVDFVLSDEQKQIIRDKYMERNKLTLCEIADKLHRDRKTISSQHKKAINSLSKALLPINKEYMEINNLDFMLDGLKSPA